MRSCGSALPRSRSKPTPNERSFGWSVAIRHGLVLAGLMYAASIWLRVQTTPDPLRDSLTYWSVNLADPYTLPVGIPGSFPYSPAVAQLFAVVQLVPFPIFLAAWTALLVGLVLWLVPFRWWIPALALAHLELWVGNVHLLIAASVVFAFTRSSAFWAVPLLLKITPGIGVLWYLVRREWKPLALALGLTFAIAAVSFLVSSVTWAQWWAYLGESSVRETTGVIEGPRIPIPLWIRLSAAVAIVAFAARTNRVWLVPVGVMLAMPNFWTTTVVVLYAIPRLRKA